jgi:hypothetical protein
MLIWKINTYRYIVFHWHVAHIVVDQLVHCIEDIVYNCHHLVYIHSNNDVWDEIFPKSINYICFDWIVNRIYYFIAKITSFKHETWCEIMFIKNIRLGCKHLINFSTKHAHTEKSNNLSTDIIITTCQVIVVY